MNRLETILELESTIRSLEWFVEAFVKEVETGERNGRALTVTELAQSRAKAYAYGRSAGWIQNTVDKLKEDL